MKPLNKVAVIIHKATGREIALVAKSELKDHHNGSAEAYLAEKYNECLTDAEVSVSILDYQDFYRAPLYFSTGNVVQWHDGLYIVAEYHVREDSRALVLLPFTAAGSRSHPSDMWPLDPRIRISSVEWLATCMQDFLVAKFLNIFYKEAT